MVHRKNLMGPRSVSDRIFGIHPLIEALKAGREVGPIYIAKGRGGENLQILIQLARSKGVPVRFEDRPVLDRIVGGAKHQGVMGLASAKNFAAPEDILKIAGERGESPAVLILDGIEDPRNLGAILRTADAAGFHGAVIPQRRASGLTETVSKASAGALEHIAVARAVNLTQTIEKLKAEGLWIYGMDADAPKSYLELDYRVPLALVMGGEGRGIRHHLLKSCDERIHLPMKGRVASLNVSVAFGVVAYEILRQRSR